jgi:dTDP-4-dehydrorhamnose reductase
MDTQHKFLILGANGQLGRQFKLELESKGSHFDAPEEKASDLTNFQGIEQVIDAASPTVIINCAAYNAVEEAERKADVAYLVNSKAVEHLADVCKSKGIFLVHYSSDYVFDGRKGTTYVEQDKTNPLNVYGKSKLAGERAVRETLDDFLLFRTSWVYGDGTQNFIHKLLNWAAANRELKLSDDEVSVPTSTKDLAGVTLLAIEKGITGMYHLTNGGNASRYEWGRYVLEYLGKPNPVQPALMNSFPSSVERPRFTAMDNRSIELALGITIPDWKTACSQFLDGSRTSAQ